VTVRRTGESSIVLEGICPIAEAEVLRQLLVSAKSATVDWRACEWAHTAIVQVLLASKVELRGQPKSAFLGKLLDTGIRLTEPGE
jgi:hypothetical protein